MGPPVTKIVGRSSRAAAISMPGTILSHEQSITMPSKRLASTISSTDAAITSRSGRIECIPLPWAMPSHGATVLNSAVAPPACAHPLLHPRGEFSQVEVARDRPRSTS